ncbi:MAG: tetratricopeptide repeat protein [Alphaproteobacteria bacterium]|nr:tetratricopeptide repeat protein [Alphaproteobacteria bacterium]
MVEKAYQRISKDIIFKVIGSCLLPITLLYTFDVRAQSINLISDEETETLIADISKPLFKAANVTFTPNNIYIVNDNSLNAFVADGNRLFIHTGTLISADSPNEISGVIAHETGHIAGGHIIRQKLKNQSLQEIGLASAIAAGAAAVLSGRGDVAMATMLGAQSSTLTNYLQYRTEEERSADEAAIKLLKATNQSPDGMLNFMKKVEKRNNMQGFQESPYFRTHPITRERISFFENAKNKTQQVDDAKMQQRFNLVKAKLFAFLMPYKQTLHRYPTNNNSLEAFYARSIAYFKAMQLPKAINEINNLIAQQPDNPFFHELKGQIYLETGKIKEARKEYKKALDLMPNSSLLQIAYAQSILEDNPSKADIQNVINILNKALISRPTTFAWLMLARAYGLQNKMAHANYASAEYSTRIGAFQTAKEQLAIAKKYSSDQALNLKISDLEMKLKSKL